MHFKNRVVYIINEINRNSFGNYITFSIYDFREFYISRHIDLIRLGYVLKGGFDYMELVFNFLSIVIIYKSSIHDKKYMDVNLIISVIKSTFGMPKLHYLVSLYFWFVAFIIHYDTIFGRYTDIIVNLLLCPPQYLLKNNIIVV